MSDFSNQQQYSSAVPIAVRVLLIVNVVIFGIGYLDPVLGRQMVDWLGLWPMGAPETVNVLHSGMVYQVSQPPFYLWQVLTYSFLHGGWAHIFFNMYALFLFGSVLERLWGWQRFCCYYFLCVLGAAVTQLIVTYGGHTPTVGASGGVFGLLLAFGVFFPRTRLQLFFPPVALEARWFVLIYGLIELGLGITRANSGIAHFAHLGGMVFGLPLVWYWKRQFMDRFTRF